MTDSAPQGSLVCVGLGMLLGAHLTPRARSCIEQAEVVFVAASETLVDAWVREIRPDARSLHGFYEEGRPRRETYLDMVETMLVEVRKGRQVCGAFYGHPGVFAQVPHDAIAQARREGLAAAMEPGVSTADCLYADIGLDPGRVGCQHYEASQFLLYRRRIDTSAWLVLWQVGLVGDRAAQRFSTGSAHRQLLVDRLLRDYPHGHEVILYEARTLPVDPVRKDRLRLDVLPHAEIEMHTTLVIPPARLLEPDPAMQASIAALEQTGNARPHSHLTLVKT